MRRPALVVVAALAGLLLAGAPGAQAQAPLRIRIAWAVVPGHLFPVLFEHKEALRHYGVSYTVEPVHFAGSAPEIAALATGDLEIAALGFSSFGTAIENAHMTDLRVIGDATRDGHDGYETTRYAVRADDTIRKVEDLKGRVLATNGIGGATYMAMRLMLLDHGLVERRDYQVVEAQFPNMLPMLEGKKADLVPLLQPFLSMARQSGKVRMLFTMQDVMGETQTTLLAARAPFIAAHRAALVDFFEDMQRGLHWMVDPAHRQAAIATIAAFTKRPAANYAGWLFTKDDDYRDPEFRPNLAALQHNLDVQQRLGLLAKKLVVKDYADLSLIEAAARRWR